MIGHHFLDLGALKRRKPPVAFADRRWNLQPEIGEPPPTAPSQAR